MLKKYLHSTDQGTTFLQNSSYVYNERGWLKTTNSAQFSFELRYQDGTTPQYNGNISNQLWGAGGNNPNKFTYTYDKLNRLRSGVSTGIVMNEAVSYDAMGNITTLNREGVQGTYSYTGNRLNSVSGGTLATGTYSYKANGSATTDGRTGVVLTYNHLNLPVTATKTGLALSYIYDATGNKLRKTSNGVVRHYIDGIEYNGSTLEIIHTEEGLIRKSGTTYSYEYNLTDHLGNARYSFYKNPETNTITKLAETNYYPFGKAAVVLQGNNKYLYNGKELQDELGQLDYGARFYDPVIGRWNVIDPLAEKSRRFSPYVYGDDNPIRNIDPDGMQTQACCGFFVSPGINTIRSILVWAGYVGNKSEAVRKNYQKSIAPLTERTSANKIARAEIKAEARLQTPQPVKGYLDVIRPMEKEMDKAVNGLVNNPSKTNAKFDAMAENFGKVGKVATVGAAALSIYNVATSENKPQALAHEGGAWAGAWTGGVAGAEGGAALGFLGGPFAEITVPVGGLLGGIGGSILGGIQGGKVGDAVYNSVTKKEDKK